MTQVSHLGFISRRRWVQRNFRVLAVSNSLLVMHSITGGMKKKKGTRKCSKNAVQDRYLHCSKHQ